MRLCSSIAIVVALGMNLLIAQCVNGQNYRLERIASGLNQPTYVTQAPGDSANILYYTERTRDANPGFGAGNSMGRVWRYDVDTRTSTMVLDLASRTVTNDTGLQTITFHPDFNTPATLGYGKLYVSSSEAGGTALNRVEEYNVNLSGPNPTYTASFSRTLLEYQNNAQNNHTINWIGFNPTAAGGDRNYLYISTGDGSFGNDYNAGTSPGGRPSQNPNDIAGKMLRVNVVGADAYPADPLKNYAIPASNPIPAYNAANPESPIDGLGEVYLTGLRNVYRASFDRATGDLYMGDVGEVFVEEVSFLKAGSNLSGPPVDFGWPQREGTFESDIDGAPDETTNPFTGAASLEPLQQFFHDGGGEAIIGGYLYRGPVTELQGKYFYSDFVNIGNAAQIWMLDFDRDTDPANFNGNNGTNTDISALWQSLVYDPTDPSYQPSSSPTNSAGLDHIVSFGEDNAGNMYLVDFGNGTGFNGQYPGPGLGEIFRLTPILEVTVSVDRESGQMQFANATGETVELQGYRLVSGAGAIDPAELSPITGRLDADPGDGSIDPNNPWMITSTAGDNQQFSESSTGGAASLAADQGFELSPADGWIRSIYEDIRLEVTLANGSSVPAVLEFVGNGDQPFGRSDLNFNGQLDPGDWPLFRDNHLSDLSSLTLAQSYQLGDLDGDGDNDFDDFRLFQADYVAANGIAAFAALAGTVPEPTSLALLAVACLSVLGIRSRTTRNVSLRTPFARMRELFASPKHFASVLPLPRNVRANCPRSQNWAGHDHFGGDGRGEGAARLPALPFSLTLSPQHCRQRPTVGLAQAGNVVGRGDRMFAPQPQFSPVPSLFAARGRARQLALFVAACLMVWVTANDAHADLKHRYSFTADVSDSVGGMHGAVVDAGNTPNANFTGGLLDLSSNEGDGSGDLDEDAYVDLPNGIVSGAVNSGTIGAVSFEWWATVTEQQTWQRFGDFGTSNFGEDTSFAGSNSDYVMITPNSGRYGNGLEITNHPATDADEPSVGEFGQFPLDTETHILAVYDHTNTLAGPNGTMTLYRDGTLIGANDIHPDLDLRTFEDNNNWLGRSQWNDPIFSGTFNEFRIYDHALDAGAAAFNFMQGPDVAIEPVAFFALEVNTVTGSVRLLNQHSDPMSLDYYRVASAAGALDTEGWSSLDDQELDAMGQGEGESWDENGPANESLLAELFLLGASTFEPGVPIDLGHMFNSSALGQGQEGDLLFEFARGGEMLATGEVLYVTPALTAGDYNNDGTVGAADYTVWRDNLGTAFAGADGDGDGVVDEDDFAIWQWNFGNSASLGAQVSIPEPASGWLLILAWSGLHWSRRWN